MKGKAIMQIITVDESRCVGCNACVRVCPVHANVTRLKEGMTDEFITGIDSEACINCGECVKVCMHHARGYHDNINEFVEAFESKKPMILIVAPAVRTSFPDGAWRVLLSWLETVQFMILAMELIFVHLCIINISKKTAIKS